MKRLRTLDTYNPFFTTSYFNRKFLLKRLRTLDTYHITSYFSRKFLLKRLRTLDTYSRPGRKGVDTGKNCPHTSCWPSRIIYNDQATRYLIYSHLQSTFDKDGKIARKRTSNHCLPREFWHRKIPWFQKNYIGRSLIVPKQVLIWIPHLVQDSNGKKIMWKKNESSSVPIWHLQKKIIVLYR